MKNRTEGAWIIHHTKKLQDIRTIPDFEDIELAGKCGLFLSSLAASDEESTLSKAQVDAIAEANNINRKLELPIILQTLSDAQLIDVLNKGDLTVLGITTSNVLSHTSEIFQESGNSFQKAALELTNYSSETPLKENILQDYIADYFKLDKKTNLKLFQQAEEIGFIDYETIDSSKTYFNGNLFKRDTIAKTAKVLESLSSEDSRKVRELDNLIISEGCVSHERAVKILGQTLLSKLQAIAMYDFNEVSNNLHSKIFLTKPSSFAKVCNPFEEDALDMAKAFISSLIYGMKISTSRRGRINDFSMLGNTIRKLLRGEKVGPCTAIGQDYQILELNRVIQLEHSFGTRYYMKLLKFDIGRLALSVLENGDLAEQTTLESNLTSTSVSKFSGPEKNRWKVRRKKETTIKSNIGELLRTMRN